MAETCEVGFVFWILAAVIVISGVLVVSLKNVFHCALFLIFCLSGVAGIFILLHAEFLAAAQVLIYVGAVAILMVFAIMLTSNLASRKIVMTNRKAGAAALASAAFVAGIYYLIRTAYAADIWRFTVEGVAPEAVVLLSPGDHSVINL